MKTNKVGYIKVSNEVLDFSWETFAVIFKDFRPTHIEYRHWENKVWYFYGVSDLFQELLEGQAVPQYDVTFTGSGEELDYKIGRYYE